MDFEYPYHNRLCRCLDNYLPFLKHEDPFSMLEIGVLEGGGACHCIVNYPVREYVGIDPWLPYPDLKQWDERKADEVCKRAKQNIGSVASARGCDFRLIRGKSDDVLSDPQAHELSCGQFKLIYVDGFHREEQVLRDGRHCWELLAVDGLIVFDDIQDGGVRAGVERFLQEIVTESRILPSMQQQVIAQKTG